MQLRSTAKSLIASAIFALSLSVGMAQTSGESAKAAAAEVKATAKDAAKKKGPGGTSLQDLLRQLQQNREAMIADHDALAKQLKDATEEEKKALKERMETQMKRFEVEQGAIHKQIRDEQRRQRQSPPGKR